VKYKVILPNPVVKQIDSLPSEVHSKVLDKLKLLVENPRPHGCIKLKGYKNEYRMRVGRYRIRYEVNDTLQTIVVLHCGHRKDIYR